MPVKEKARPYCLEAAYNEMSDDDLIATTRGGDSQAEAFLLNKYQYLVHVKGEGGAPEMLLYTDRPFLLDLILWGIAVVLIMYVFNT